MTVVLIAGLLINAIVLPLAARRVWFLYRVITSGQPAPDRIAGALGRAGTTIKRQVVEVFGQKKLLTWSIPGAAHFFVFWAFLILGTVYLEAYAVLLSRNPEWHFLFFGKWAVLGFVQDFIGVMCLLGIVTFWAIRLRNQPKELGRKSRFFGSHLGPAYFTLLMIFNVLWSLFLFRGAVEARDMGSGNGYGKAAFVSYALGTVLPDSTALIGIGLLLHIGVMLVFLLFVLNSKHLHIFLAPLNVMFGRYPVALGAAKPMMNDGKPLTLDDVDDLDEDAKLGVGSIEDFSWKGLLDFATCTECGRCQSQCPAWNTEKPLSPKLLIMNLRDHAMAKAPYVLANGQGEALAAADEGLAKEVARPLIGDESAYGVIDPDVLWSCVTCGACVQQCPVDIEHVDHILDMRRYQVLVESNFPAELNGLFKGMENKGNPWNLSPSARLDWTKDLDFEVKVVGDSIESLDEVDWLFWVGCAGAYEDRAKKTTRAVAELLDRAGVSFGVLGTGETCTGDSARRAGNEFLFQGLAQENIDTFKEHKVKQVVTTCAHCFNTLKNEYTQFGIELEVVHHTQLLNRLVREGKLTPVATGDGAHQRSITYHDPCYIGRHNGVYSPPRELLSVLPGASFVEMPRNSERSFCCGAGGARMWMEENIGSRINMNRTNEAIATGADQIAVGCPFCRVMLSDGLTAAIDSGDAREEVEVLDVAQMLLASVRGEVATRVKAGSSVSVATKAEPSAGDVTATADTVTATEDAGPAAKASGGSSLFDSAEAQAPAATAAAGTSAAAEAKAATPAASGGSLFDATDSEPEPAKPASSGGSLFDTPADPAPEAKAAPAKPAPSGGSLFDTPADPAPEAKEAAPAADAEPADLSSGGSLFDVAPQETAPAESAPAAADTSAAAEPATQTAPSAPAEASAPAEPAAKPAADLGSGSLFDIAPQETAAPEQPDASSAPADATEPAAASEPAGSTEPASEPPAESTSDDETTAEAPAAEAAPAQPAVDLSSGGSLFDIAAPAEPPAAAKPASTEPAGAAAPAEAAAPVESETTAPESAEPVESAEPAEAAAPEAAAPAESEEPARVAEAAAPAESASADEPPAKPSIDLSSGGSLFDIAAPEALAASPAPPAAAATPAATHAADTEPVEAESEPEPSAEADSTEESNQDAEPAAVEPTADTGAGAGGGAAVTQSTFATTDTWPAGDTTAETEPAADESVATETEPVPAATEDELEAEEQPATESGSEPAEDEEPAAAVPDESQPSSNGTAHTPKTDADIGGASSLFDL